MLLSEENYAKGLVQRIEQGRREWVDLNKEQREKQKRVHDAGVDPVHFRVGDYVLEKRRPKKQPKLVTKWLSRMLGPFEIVERVQGTENIDPYILEDVQTKARCAPTNVDALVPWIGMGRCWRSRRLRRQRPLRSKGHQRMESGGELGRNPRTIPFRSCTAG